MTKDINSQASRFFKSEYTAAIDNPHAHTPLAVSTTALSPDAHIETGYEQIVEWGRELDRNATNVIPPMNRMVTSVIGTGFVPAPNTGDSELDRQLVESFVAWGNDRTLIDYEKRLTFFEMQEMIFRSVLRDGDMFILPIDNGSIQLVESHLCRNPDDALDEEHTKDFLGVRYIDGMIDGYWFSPDLDTDPEYYPAFASDGTPLVWHINFINRHGLTRGISALSSVRDDVQMMVDLKLATLLKAKINSTVCMIETDMADAMGEVPDVGMTPSATQKIAPGAKIIAPRGKKIDIWSGNVPNAEFFNHVEMVNRDICANIGVPVESAYFDPTKANFSALRQAIQDAREGFRSYQFKLIAMFYRPLWNHYVSCFSKLNKGQIRIPDDESLYNCSWNAPSWDYLEPLTDAKADTERLANGSASHSMICRERHGVSGEKITTEQINDTIFFVSECQRAVEELQKQKVDISWREVAAIARPNVAEIIGTTSTDTTSSTTESDTQKTTGDQNEQSTNKQ